MIRPSPTVAGELRTGMPLQLATHRYQDGVRHRAHAHDEMHLSLLLTGDVIEHVGRSTERGRALSVVCKDAGVVHADHFGPGETRLARLTLPGGTLASLVDDRSRAPDWRWTHDPRVAAPFLRLVRRAHAGSPWFATTDPDVIELVAAFTTRATPERHGTPPAWLANIMREVTEGWHCHHSTASLAAAATVHPVYLARCVRRWFGTTLSVELRRQRLLATTRLLHDRTRTVSDVAHSCGYADEPHLNRAFRAAVGMTPGQFRRLIRGAPATRRRSRPGFENSSAAGGSRTY